MRRRWGVVGVVTVLGCATSIHGRRDDGGRPRDVVATDALVATDCVDGAACATPDVPPPCDIPARAYAGPAVACTPSTGDPSTAQHFIAENGTLTALVWNGSDYAFVWSVLESRAPVLFGLYFGRADRNGELVPGSVHRVFASDRHQTRGALAVGADGYGLAWLDLPSDGLTVGMRAHFARLDFDGALIVGSERLLSTQHAPHQGVAIAYSAPLRQWAVAWQGQVALGGGNVESHAYLSRIEAACAIVEPNAALLDALRSTTDPDFAPSLVWARDRYAIVLSEYVAIPNARVSIAEIDPTTAAVTRRIVLREGGRPLRATLATDGAMYGAAWMQLGLDTPTSNAVWFRRAAVGGDALGEAVALADGRDSGEPAVLFDGDTFRVAFSLGDERAGGVWRARFSRDGAVVGTPGLRFAGTPPFSAFPLLASDGCNDAIGWTAIASTGGQSATVRLHLRATAAD